MRGRSRASRCRRLVCWMCSRIPRLIFRGIPSATCVQSRAEGEKLSQGDRGRCRRPGFLEREVREAFDGDGGRC